MARTIRLIHGDLTKLHAMTGYSKEKIRRAVAGDDSTPDYQYIRDVAKNLHRRQ